MSKDVVKVLVEGNSATSKTVASTAISYDKIMGVNKLSNGLVFRRSEDNQIIFSFTITCLQDLYWVGLDTISKESDGTNTMLAIETNFAEPLIIDSRSNDFATLTLADDLSGLISARAVLIGVEEDIP